MDGNLLLTNLGKTATLKGAFPRTGKAMDDLQVLEQIAIAIENGIIQEVGPQKEMEEKYKTLPIFDGKGKTVLPGFIDPHTHLPFAGSRENEFEMRIQGKTYVEIAKEGGGILRTVQSVRQASKEALVEASLSRANRILQHGVTTVEAKSGYGLSLVDEIKQLEAIQELQKIHPIDFIPTFLGAHEVPPEYRNQKEKYISLLCEEMIPQIAERKLAKFCDIFCEAHVFQIEESRRILLRGKEFGLTPKLHADEIKTLGGAELAAEIGAISADHLEVISEKGILALAEKKVMAVLLPGTSFYLRIHYAPARALIEKGAAVALATDLNPGSSMTESLPLILTLACLYMKMSPREAITAATVNAACAIGLTDRGSIEPGKLGDIVLWDVPSPEYIPYHYGVSLVNTVIKRGNVVWEKGK